MVKSCSRGTVGNSGNGTSGCRSEKASVEVNIRPIVKAVVIRLVRLARLSCWRRDRRKPTELGGFVAVLLAGVGLSLVLVGGCWTGIFEVGGD
jgi:hypothetical protein